MEASWYRAHDHLIYCLLFAFGAFLVAPPTSVELSSPARHPPVKRRRCWPPSDLGTSQPGSRRRSRRRTGELEAERGSRFEQVMDASGSEANHAVTRVCP